MVTPIGKHLDALYVSILGELPDPLIQVLRHSKEQAREDSENITELFADELVPGGTLYIQARGTRGYEFVLRNQRLYIQLTAQKHLPAMQIQFLAEALYEYDFDGLEKIVQRLADLLVPNNRGHVVSRCDVAVDFQSSEDKFELPENKDVVSRAVERGVKYKRQTGETYTLGKHGGALQVQIYNKTAEATKKGKTWLRDVWAQSPDYHPDLEVWRAEVRMYRDGLSSMQIRTMHDLRAHLGDVLQYVVGSESNGSWCRFVDPATRGNQAQTRQPAEWWRSVSRRFMHGELKTGRTRLRPKGLTSFARSVEMYVSWAAKAAALARAGGFHNAAGDDFGKWLFRMGQIHTSARKGKTWADLVNDQTSKLRLDVGKFEGAVFDLRPAEIPKKHRDLRAEKLGSLSFTGVV